MKGRCGCNRCCSQRQRMKRIRCFLLSNSIFYNLRRLGFFFILRSFSKISQIFQASYFSWNIIFFRFKKRAFFFKQIVIRDVSLGQGLLQSRMGHVNLYVVLALVKAQLNIIIAPSCCLGCKLCPRVGCVYHFLLRCKSQVRLKCVG